MRSVQKGHKYLVEAHCDKCGKVLLSDLFDTPGKGYRAIVPLIRKYRWLSKDCAETCQECQENGEAK